MTTTLTLTHSQARIVAAALVTKHQKLTQLRELFDSEPDLTANAMSVERDLAALAGIVEQLPEWCRTFVADEIARGVGV